MDNNTLINEIINTIKQSVSPLYENTAKTEIYVRCPECGDSKKNRSSAHFYIQTKPPFRFYCQKCGYSGALNKEVLEKLNIFNNNTLLNIAEVNRTNQKENNNVIYKPKLQQINLKEEENQRTIKSIEYFNKRFKTEYDIGTLNNKFKVICAPERLLDQLHIDYSHLKLDVTNAIGFISSDNKYLVCRDISGKQECRYANIPLSKEENKSKIYNIKTKVSMLSDVVTLVITEGIFDAIGVYEKFYKDADDVIIAASCGKSSYDSVIDKFIKMGFLSLNVVIYSDTDVPLESFKALKANNKFISKATMIVYYNTLEKDCGVPKDRIEVTKFIV